MNFIWESGIRKCSKTGVWKLDISRPEPGRMEETLEGGQGPFWAVVPLEGERDRERESERAFVLITTFVFDNFISFPTDFSWFSWVLEQMLGWFPFFLSQLPLHASHVALPN
jgi:hypothetical protein